MTSDPVLATRDWRAIADRIAAGGEFRTSGAIKGQHGRFTRWDSGQLPESYVDEFTNSDYAVFSYATPIAYRVAGRWIVPDVSYSLTTTRHQATIRAAVERITSVAGGVA